MEQIIIKALPFFIFVGLGARFLMHWRDKDYPYDRTTEQGKQNIRNSVFSLVITIIVFIPTLIIKADDSFDTSTLTGVLAMAGWFFTYLIIGWAIDSIFLAIMKKGEANIQRTIDTVTETKIVEKTKETD